MAPKKLSAADIEAQKTNQERAEDAAYVINHAISCGTTDTFIQPFAGAFVQNRIENGSWPKSLMWLRRIFESHDHHGHGHEEHDHHDHAHEAKPTFRGNLRHWFLGEAAGDFLAVPLTVWVQRHMPGVTHLMRKLLEPFAGGYFHKGAHRDAQRWGAGQGFNPDSPVTLAREKELYENEMRHLPLAFVWNAFSIPINLAAQKLSGSKASWGTMLAGKTFGSLFSNVVLLGGRAIAPATFEKWDAFNSKHVVLPVTKAAGKLFGVDAKTADKVSEYHTVARLKAENNAGKNWVERAQESSAEQNNQPLI